MAESQPPVSGRKEGHCPVCGQKPDAVTEISPENSEKDIPGMAYDHEGGSLCIEWANGETE